MALGTYKAQIDALNDSDHTSKIKASVVICTYNRSKLLSESLKALEQQQFEALQYEIVVVDNNSSDDTRAVTEQAAASSEVAITYVFEGRQGLSFARNAGIENAAGEVVAFVDDDIDAEPGWLAAIVAAFADSKVACAGGPIRPVWPSERPEWLTDDWVPYLTINEFDAARKAGSFTWPDTPWGANISFRKNVFDSIGLFPTNLGRIGSSLLSNEEVNICKKIAQAGLRIAFAPEAVIHHKIDPHRVTRQWFYHRTYWQGRSDAILDANSQSGNYDGICQRLRRYLEVAAKEGAVSFTARCARKIAIGYLFEFAFAGQQERSVPALRAISRYIDQLQAVPQLAAAAASLPEGASDLLGKSILVVDYEVPQFDKYAGSRTTFMYLKLLAELGLKVYFLPDDFEQREPYSTTLEDLGITVLQGEWYRENWQRWVVDHRSELDYVLFNRPNITVSYIDFVKAHTDAVILFQGHDLHYLRLSRKYEVDGDPETLQEAETYREIEFEIIEKSDATLTYSEYERQVLADLLPGERIHAVPLFFYDDFPAERLSFAGRKDIMFVGGCGHKPNLDAILWFAREIFPKVLAQVPDMVLHVIGTYPPQEVRDLACDNIRIHGHVSEQELEEYYRQIRMVVIPLRFGAGVKGKTVEALRNGVPMVSTAIGLEGIPGIDAVSRPADRAEDFAQAVVAQYQDEKSLELTSALYREFARVAFHSSAAKRTLADILVGVPLKERPAPHQPETENAMPRLIAMYLPQYHPIPENDEWWGKGFTEWRNVAKAKPLFKGHYQPHVPADLSFYDLRLEETRIAQAELARQYGVHGFCYYHYWFNGRRLLETPLEAMLKSGKPDFPFCVCWANENWTRRWDGEEQNVLMKQVYSEEDDRNHIRDLFRVFEDPRYIRVNGKPMFLVYRTENIPDPAATARIWREEARAAGIGELYLVRVESIGTCDPASIGFDAALEFAPDWQKKGPRIMPEQDTKLPGLDLLNEVYRNNYVHHYDNLADEMMAKPGVPYKRFRCVTPSWDNSARRQEGANIFVGSTPDKYRQWLEHVLSFTRQRFGGDERIAFVNAWNEWAEGNHLEPDQKFGRAYLEATKSALDGVYEVPVQPAAVQEVDLSQYQHEVLALQQQLAAVQREKEELERAAALLKEQLAARDELVAAREARIEDLLHSASWKVTEPLRKAYEVAQKMQGKK
ncbi:glycoside hydrolase family 99-like domain-containing protein [Geomonas paludis]|uniref:Glycoside hydrolase family 99-like domain-containing protein n=2 Tax=Geomonas paludis TaxID=2740185 RepID=A0ABY4LGI9_9BACT|nr:glycoside hydrolase family 99-like domain-containing protein [Geomonas paludis]UPU37089.1 glycoside hydrolase family 99-like domain-containing protein [Geomonas paludis]